MWCLTVSTHILTLCHACWHEHAVSSFGSVCDNASNTQVCCNKFNTHINAPLSQYTMFTLVMPSDPFGCEIIWAKGPVVPLPLPLEAPKVAQQLNNIVIIAFMLWL